jgi:hypothetical protein
MSCDKKNESSMNPLVRYIAALPLLIASLFASPAALAVDSGDIVVAGIKGEVHFTVSGAERAIRAGGVLEPPATLRTGRDGAVELRQGATTVSVGPDTLLEFPALEKRGAPIDRILQPRGNAFYDVGKRAGRKLRIETPYLVGVVKGTQFNIAAQDHSTTISLFEGLLEVRAADDSAVIDLKAGEIASRKHGDASIGVTKMDAGKTPATRPPAGGGSGNTHSPTPPRAAPASGDGTRLVDNDATIPMMPGGVDNPVGSAAVGVTAAVPGVVEVDANATANAPSSIGVDAGTAVNAAPSVEGVADTRVDAGPVSVDAGAAVDVGGGTVEVSTSTNVGAGPVSVDAGAGVSLGGSGVDVGANASVNAGPVSVDTGAASAVGGGVDLSTTTAVDAGPVAVDAGTSTAVDVGTGTIDAGTAAAVDAGPLTTDVGAGAAVDLAAGTVETGVTVGASAPGVVVDVGTSVAADVAAGSVNLGLEVAGADLGVGVDLGLDDAESTPATPAPENTNTVDDVRGLLDGLLRRPGRR